MSTEKQCGPNGEPGPLGSKEGLAFALKYAADEAAEARKHMSVELKYMPVDLEPWCKCASEMVRTLRTLSCYKPYVLHDFRIGCEETANGRGRPFACVWVDRPRNGDIPAATSRIAYDPDGEMSEGEFYWHLRGDIQDAIRSIEELEPA